MASSRNVSAINFALSGSPGMSTVLAKAPSGAEMWGVLIIVAWLSVDLYIIFSLRVYLNAKIAFFCEIEVLLSQKYTLFNKCKEKNYFLWYFAHLIVTLHRL